jgi:hypothetical protein
MQRLIPLLSCALLTGCAAFSVKQYSGPELPINQQVTLAAQSFYVGYAAMVVSHVDGKFLLESGNVSEYLLAPGEHELTITVQTDVKILAGGYPYLGVSFKTQKFILKSQFEPGHSYIPGIQQAPNGGVQILVIDKGLGFALKCMPLRLFKSGQTADDAGC